MSSARIAEGVPLNRVTYEMLIPLKGDWKHLVATYVADEVGTPVTMPVRNQADVAMLTGSTELGAIWKVEFHGSSDGRVVKAAD